MFSRLLPVASRAYPKGIWPNKCFLVKRALHITQSYDSSKLSMPSLSPTMTEGTIVKWMKKEGEAFDAGEVLCEIQTDKAVVSLEADDQGVLAKILMGNNDGAVKVGTSIAIIAEEDEDWKAVAASSGSEPDSASASPESASSEEAEDDTPSGGSTVGKEINMPSLSPTMTEGTIVKWNKKEGEALSAGDVLCEIQTDKAVVSMEVDDDVILAKILAKEGDSGIKVGQLIALTVEEGEDWQDVQIPKQKKEAKPKKQAPTKSTDKSESKDSRTATEMHYEHLHNVGPATMLLLAQYGIKASDVSPTGPKGLLKGDVMAHIEKNKLSPLKLEEKAPKQQQMETKNQRKPTSGYTDIPLTSMRTVIAKRLTQSKQTSPHGHATLSANMDNVLRIRKEFAAKGVKVSVNDFVIKAVGTALQIVPEMNLNVKDEEFEIMSNVDISVAVATDSGLITPIVTNVPAKSLQQISSDVKELAGKAREGKLQLQEFQGGTFTISNLGMFGVYEFTAIINPPQVGILAVGTSSKELDPRTGKAKDVMRATLSFDRRFIDEALASDFMSTLTSILEHPEYMNLGIVNTIRANRDIKQYIN